MAGKQLTLGIYLLVTPLAAQDLYRDRVAPIFARTCMPCHDERTHASGFSVATKEAVMAGGARLGASVLAGKAAESPLLKVLSGEVSPRMPLGKPPLGADEMATIRQWIESVPAGATTTQQKHWAFVPPVAVTPPDVSGTWARNAIDHFIQSGLAAKQLTPGAEAPKRMLLRRLYFDLIGVPPSFEETKAFVESTDPRSYEQVVDKLLADRRYGERWARHWLDLARYADTQGFEADRENYHMWRYRDYVVDAFNNDKPYDQFIREQLAGDELGTPDGRTGAAFLRLTPRYQTTNAQLMRQLVLDELTATVGGVFLGLTVKCAQCHDHKYDPIPQRDFYRLQAFFSTIEMLEQPQPFNPEMKTRMEAARKDVAERLRQAQARFDAYQKEMFAKAEARGLKLPADDRPVAPPALAADEVTTESFLRPMTQRLAMLEGKIGRAIANGVVPNTDDSTFTLEEKQRYIELLTWVDGNRGGRDMGTLQRELRRYAPTIHTVRNIPNDSNRPSLPVTFVRVNGDFDKPGEWVLPGFLSAVEGHSEPARLTLDQFGNTRGWRLPLAQWIASSSNPLTARVMANRIWQHLFGAGIVASASDFGRNGAKPSNAALLDYLATRFTGNQWSTKKLIREIVLSSTYRQTSVRAGGKEEAADPANTLLWRQNRRRVEGEIIRDSVLSAAGALESEHGGPGVFIPLPVAMKDRMTIKNQPSWTPSSGPEIRKRSLYVFQRRQLEVPLFGLMDASVFPISCERRAVSTTPLQALTLMNDDFTTENVARLAARVRRDAGPDGGEQVEQAFRLALGRGPEAKEKAQARALPLESLCRALLNTNEFVYVD